MHNRLTEGITTARLICNQPHLCITATVLYVIRRRVRAKPQNHRYNIIVSRYVINDVIIRFCVATFLLCSQ